MPSPAELAANAAMLAFMFGAVRYLRATQPDPNPAIEAREAAAEAAKQHALATATSAPVSVEAALPAAAPDEERRHNPLPFVGTDRRAGALARDADAWRRSA
jgi:hypothetical protein